MNCTIHPFDSQRRNEWASLISNLDGVTYGKSQKAAGGDFRYDMNPGVDNLLRVFEHLLYPDSPEYKALKTRKERLDFLCDKLSEGDRKLTWNLLGPHHSNDIDRKDHDLEIGFSINEKPAFKFKIEEKHADPFRLSKEKRWTSELPPSLQKHFFDISAMGSGSSEKQEMLASLLDDHSKDDMIEKLTNLGDSKKIFDFLFSYPLDDNESKFQFIESILKHKLRQFYPAALKVIRTLPTDNIRVQCQVAETLFDIDGYTEGESSLQELKDMKSEALSRVFARKGRGALSASNRGWLKVFKALTQNDPALFDIRNPRGENSLVLASKQGHKAIVDYILDSTGSQTDFKDRPDKRGATALFTAAENGRLEVVQSLVERGADLNRSTTEGNSPLGQAVADGHLEVVKYLVSKGASTTHNYKNGNTPLHLAVLGGHLNIVNALKPSQANLRAKNRQGYTPLYLAASEGRLDFVKLFRSMDVDLKSHQSGEGESPLMAAAENGHLDVLKYLADAGEDIRHKDQNNRTPFIRAVISGHTDIVKFLVNAGADINALDSKGETPFTIAALKGRLDMIQTMVEKIQDVNKIDLFDKAIENAGKKKYGGTDSIKIIQFLTDLKK